MADDVFAQSDHSPVATKNTMLTKIIIERFYNHGVTHVPVDVSEAFWKTIALEEKPQEEYHVDEIKPIINKKLREEALDGIRRMFDAVKNGTENMTTAYQVVKEVNTIVDQLVDTLEKESNSLVHITDLKSYDEYTYHHSLSVAVLSIAIAQSLGLSGEQLRSIGRCGMLHDIGKILLPVDIINKPRRLNNTEFYIVKQHSKKGYDYLRKGKIEDETIRQGILCHHEKIDGTGYPNGLRGKELPLFARIVTVADVYDAVTSYRPYRKPMSPAEAIEIIMSEVGCAFDYEVVIAFISKLELYPINSRVELSNKRRGIVIDNTYPMRPLLKMTDNGETVNLMALNNLSLVIVNLLNSEDI